MVLAKKGLIGTKISTFSVVADTLHHPAQAKPLPATNRGQILYKS
jgi:hypothetical protein